MTLLFLMIYANGFPLELAGGHSRAFRGFTYLAPDVLDGLGDRLRCWDEDGIKNPSGDLRDPLHIGFSSTAFLVLHLKLDQDVVL